MAESFWITLYVALGAVAESIALIAVIFIGKAFYHLTTRIKLEEEIVKNENIALGVALAGFLSGLAIAACGGLFSIGDGPNKALMIGLVGLISMVLLRVSLFINDRFILSQFNNMKEIVADKNLGVAFVEAGECIATGLMINGVMSGRASSLTEKLHVGLIYWAIGQVVLVIGAHIYRPICGFNLDAALEHDDNAAAGLSFGGFCVATGLIVQASLQGASTSLLPEIATIAVIVAIGFLLLAVVKFALEKVLLPKISIATQISEKKNVGAAALSAVAYICIAMVFAASISPATMFASFESQMTPDEPVTAIVSPDASGTTDPGQSEAK